MISICLSLNKSFTQTTRLFSSTMTNPIMPKLYASWISPPIKSAAFKSELRRSFENMIDAVKVKTKSMINAYPDYIKPGETAYYYDETSVDFDTTGIKVVPHVDIHKSSNEVIRYDIGDISITEDSLSGVKVMGRVENKTSKKGTLVYVAANLFDSNDKLICNCFTILDNDLNAGDKIGFTCSPFAYREVKPSDVARYEIYAYPTQFNIDFGF